MRSTRTHKKRADVEANAPFVDTADNVGEVAAIESSTGAPPLPTVQSVLSRPLDDIAIHHKVAAAWQAGGFGVVAEQASAGSRGGSKGKPAKKEAAPPTPPAASCTAAHLSLTRLQQRLLPVVCSYSDLLFAGRTPANAQELRPLLAMHALQHVMRSRTIVAKNDGKLLAFREQQKQKDDLESKEWGALMHKAQKIAKQTGQSARRIFKRLQRREKQDRKKEFDKLGRRKSIMEEAAESVERMRRGEESPRSGEDSDVEVEASEGEGGPPRVVKVRAAPEGKVTTTKITVPAAAADADADAGATEGLAALLSRSAAEQEPELRDQGFRRPRVLVLMPVRQAAARFVRELLALLPASVDVRNVDRFFDTYDTTYVDRRKEEQEYDEGEEAELERLDREEKARKEQEQSTASGLARGSLSRQARGDDYRELFSGESDDCFRVGISVGKRLVRLFSDFVDSDIIVASPLGMRMIVGAPGDSMRDTDCLSSIEVFIMDQADAMLQQNWQHVSELLEGLNQVPSKTQHTDYSRVREWALDGHSKCWRQNIVTCAHLEPELSALVTKWSCNFAPRFRVRPAAYEGTVALVSSAVRQLFKRVPAASVPETDDARFLYFLQHLFPIVSGGPVATKEYKSQLARHSAVDAFTAGGVAAAVLARFKETGERHPQGRTLIFVPSYFDLVRLRNLFRAEADDVFDTLTEYTPRGVVSSVRARFGRGAIPVLLVSERLFFFFRLVVRGARHVIFYGPPREPTAYAFYVNALSAEALDPVAAAAAQAGATTVSTTLATCTALFTRYDGLRLERIVGTERVHRMVEGQRDTFLFTSE